MTVINIEGASASGKTTTSSALALRYNGYHIPEVNAWWKRPEYEYREWFFERNVDRWRIAKEKMEDHRFVVIDIDLFQPLFNKRAGSRSEIALKTQDFIIQIIQFGLYGNFTT